MDGLNLELTYTHTIAPNKYSGRWRPVLDVLAKVQVPVSRRLALQLDTGLSLDTWAFATLGLRHRLLGHGGRGTWFVSGGFGLAMVIDKSTCDYNATVPVCGRRRRRTGDDVRRARVPLLTGPPSVTPDRALPCRRGISRAIAGPPRRPHLPFLARDRIRGTTLQLQVGPASREIVEGPLRPVTESKPSSHWCAENVTDGVRLSAPERAPVCRG